MHLFLMLKDVRPKYKGFRFGLQMDNKMANCASDGSASPCKVEDIESEPFFSTPAVYFQVIDNIKGGGCLRQVAAQAKGYPIPYHGALL